MNLRTVVGLSVTFVALASVHAGAQRAAAFIDPVDGLSLDQAIARAREQNPSLRATRATIDVARGTRLQAGLRRNPSVSTELRREPSGTDSQMSVGVEWPLDLFRREGRVAVADREVAAAEFAAADRERILTAEVRTRFGDALVAVRDLDVLDELLDVTRRQYDLLRSRVDTGASPSLDRDLVDVEVRRLNADRLLQIGRVESALYDLKQVLGTPPGESIRFRDTLDTIVSRDQPGIPDEAGVTRRRPDVREAAARVALAEARIGRAQREGRFDVTLSAGYMRMDAGFPQFGLSREGTREPVRGLFHYLSGGATVMLPMFDRNQGEVAAARAERVGAVATQEAKVLSAETEIASARSMDQRAHEAVRLYGADAQRLARQNLSVVRQSYELGRTTIFDVLAEQKRYLDLERAYTETLRAAYEARTALNLALGEER